MMKTCSTPPHATQRGAASSNEFMLQNCRLLPKPRSKMNRKNCFYIFLGFVAFFYSLPKYFNIYRIIEQIEKPYVFGINSRCVAIMQASGSYLSGAVGHACIRVEVASSFPATGHSSLKQRSRQIWVIFRFCQIPQCCSLNSDFTIRVL